MIGLLFPLISHPASGIPSVLACALCGKQSETAARLFWVDLCLISVPFLLTGLACWVLVREGKKLMKRTENRSG